jgi:serine/threonine protein kinase
MEQKNKIKEFYKIGKTIGKGSFSTVKQARYRSTGEEFAVKIFKKKKMSDEDKVAVETEIEILK